MQQQPAGNGPIERLRRCGKQLPADLRQQILAAGQALVPDLIGLLGAEDLDSGWPPIHAVDLLIDLRALDAIAPLLDELVRSHVDEIIYSRLEIRLPELGAPLLEPALARFPEDVEDEAYAALCLVTAKLGVHDERIWVHLCRLFEHDAVLGAMAFGDYGDRRAVPLLARAIRESELDPEQLGPPDVVNFVEAYERLAGPLPPDLQTNADGLRKLWREAAELGEPAVAGIKIGRNEPCPCGSGKKYKRCCLANAVA